MSRRLVGSALAAASALAGLPSSHADTSAPPLFPFTTCASRVNDDPNDGIATYNLIPNVNNVPPINDPRGSVDALDITAITFRLTRTRVYAYMSVKDIPDTFRQTDSAYGYTMWFTRTGGKIARFDQVYANQALAAQGLAPTSGLTTASVGTSPSGGNPLRGVGGGVDIGKNVAYVYADRDSLEEQLGGPLSSGEELSVINGRTELWETKGDQAPGVVRRPADTTIATGEQATWKVGDDRCFPSSTVTVPVFSAQYGDQVALTAKVADDNGALLGGRAVSFAVPGESAPRLVTTDGTGKATVVVPAPVGRTYPVTVTFDGDDYTGSGTGVGSLTVRAETIRVAPLKVVRSGTARIVTATFTEDDPRAFAGQPIAWYVNGRKVATVVTNKAGQAVFKGAKPGQTVQARYLGVAGQYLAASSKVVKV